MRLRQRLDELDISPSARRRFREELLGVARADGRVAEEEQRLIDRLLPVEPGELAGIESLWRYRELLVEAAIYVSVADGEYRVEEARAVSELAHRLGLSARALHELEQRTFDGLKARVPAEP